ncbi:unnamed protein product [Trichogramma brassicae]|uniref:Uncharacterized protein n=1 Tax=Trichogramma brassicae TaxID=86971 RepID=A0A6H5I4T6_9HYME|nr:unnamed protein product [Trichogramma brassicae]
MTATRSSVARADLYGRRNGCSHPYTKVRKSLNISTTLHTGLEERKQQRHHHHRRRRRRCRCYILAARQDISRVRGTERGARNSASQPARVSLVAKRNQYQSVAPRRKIARRVCTCMTHSTEQRDRETERES